MTADFVAVDLARLSADRGEVAGVSGGQRCVWLIGYPEAALRARSHTDPDAEFQSAADVPAAVNALLDRTGGCPWVTFEQADTLSQLLETDSSGAFMAVTQFDVVEPAALALPLVAERSLEAYLAAAGLDLAPAAGLRTAVAVAALWDKLPALIGKLPVPVRLAVSRLLSQGRHPLAPLWSAWCGPSEGQAEPLGGWLREHVRAITPGQPEEEATPTCRPIDVEAVAAVFAADGPLARLMGNYEPREGQVEMARAVAGALNGGKCLLVEAGTGTGKSLAYLVPAVHFALQNNARVVVSTNTKNLQDQLQSKDLPFLGRALGGSFRSALIKGRGNYLCVDKLLREYDDAGLLNFDDQALYLAYLVSWAAHSADGDLDTLSGCLQARYPRLESYARQLASDGETCTATSARGHPCFATIARRKAFEADILVVNHSLTLANAGVEVLPTFAHLIFDEAHNLEDIATEQFGLTFERRALFGRVREVSPSGEARTLHNRLRRALGELPGEYNDAPLQAVTGVEQCAAAVLDGSEEFGQALAGLALYALGMSVDQLTRPERLRLRPDMLEGAVGEQLKTAGGSLLERLTALAKALTELGNKLVEVRAQMPEVEPYLTAVQAARNEWSEQARALSVLLALDDPQFVYWLEFVLRRDLWEWRLRAAPIEAGQALAENIYAGKAAVILTSATLTVNGSFDYFSARLGLDQAKVSGFDYPEQVMLAMPTNIALPQDGRFLNHVMRAVEDVVRLLDGRTLVLFTAKEPMLRSFEELAPRFEAIGVEPLCQFISGSRHRLAERLRRDDHAVLFGTRSFWEGIDVPGDALQCVVIVKLPFEVPDDPVFQARCEHLEAQGVNAWTRYAVPQAVIRFKQGFGRLIRTNADKGVVICLDRRLREKEYGRAFLRSVPGYRGVFEPW
ncbi:MAG: hypothetical protein HYU66_02015, partial [Armatimonadetes bacterium]|nr:hypothetical protein [Armatimonadota bacterium]